MNLRRNGDDCSFATWFCHCWSRDRSQTWKMTVDVSETSSPSRHCDQLRFRQSLSATLLDVVLRARRAREERFNYTLVVTTVHGIGHSGIHRGAKKPCKLSPYRLNSFQKDFYREADVRQ